MTCQIVTVHFCTRRHESKAMHRSEVVRDSGIMRDSEVVCSVSSNEANNARHGTEDAI